MQINNIVITVLIAAGMYALSTILHELSHMIACKILHCKVIGWKILFIKNDGHGMSFTLKGRNHCAFVTNCIKKMRIIVAAGPVTDLILALICFLYALRTNQTWCKYGLFCAACLITSSLIYNLLPMSNGDGKMLFGKDGA